MRGTIAQAWILALPFISSVTSYLTSLSLPQLSLLLSGANDRTPMKTYSWEALSAVTGTQSSLGSAARLPA